MVGRQDERKEEFTTQSGIVLKRVYTPEDIKGVDYDRDIGLPGEYPYTRGCYASMYRTYLWMIRQVMGFGTAETTAERWKELLEQGGQIGYKKEEPATTLVFDMPTNYGYDSDNPLAYYEVGRVGVAVDHYQDFVQLMKEFPMDKGFANLVVHGSPPILTAMYIAAAAELGYSIDRLRGSSKNDPFQSYLCERIQLLPITAEIRLCLDLLEYCSQHMPAWNPISVEAYGYRSFGCGAVEELALAFSTAAAYIEGGIERGLEVDVFAPRISFFIASGIDLLEEVAKFRAARSIWAKIMKERFGAKNPRAMLFRTFACTTPTDYTAQQPYINIIRGTIQALAAVLGGVQALSVTPYDEALAIPTIESHIMAIRTQQIIAEESGVPNTVDPLGGSYCIEWLTKEIEQRVWEFLQKIESWGDDGRLLSGLIKGIESGILSQEINEAAIKRQKDIEAGKRAVVGLNQYVVAEEVSPKVFRVDLELRRKKIETLARFKEGRDEGKIKKALDRLREAAKGEENLIPTLVEVVKEQVTLEEAMNVFREVFGVADFWKGRIRAK
jgi:methylmalonyl-CoA mutase N-terminal domain/subunit